MVNFPYRKVTNTGGTLTDDYSPADALSAVQRQRDKLAEQAKSPTGYHIMFGILTGAITAVMFFRNLWVLGASYVVIGLGIYALVQYYKRSKGMWVSGIAVESAGTWAYAAGALTGVGFLIAFIFEFEDKFHGGALIVAAITVVVVTWAGYRWDAAYEAELRAAA